MSNNREKQLKLSRRNFLRAGAAATVMGAIGALKAPAKLASAAGSGLQYIPAEKGQWSKLHPVHDLGNVTVRYVEHNDQWLGTTKIVGKINNFNEADHGWNLDARGLNGPKAQIAFATTSERYPLKAALFFGETLIGTNAAVEGKPRPKKLDIPDPEQMSQHIKDVVYFLRADDVGIGKMPEYAYYSYHVEDAPGIFKKPWEQCSVPVTERLPYVISFIIDQHLETMLGSTGYDQISGTQSYK